ncbi:hypothetical protein [Sphingobium abikonense]|uniref:hypothetical protein n=1 Tax=Sphingobium abikonense TaxID=86193 RepID=UPI000788E55E|nr:hypothetical protein [Sphingobium abikonense]
MRHVHLSRSVAATAIIQPWDYVAMRRAAAGLTIGQVAAMLGGRAYERHLRMLETPGMRLKLIADLTIAMPFNHDVYRQLTDLPPHQHPLLCQRCGWDEHTDVPDHLDGLTTWSRADEAICTRCEQQAAA